MTFGSCCTLHRNLVFNLCFHEFDCSLKVGFDERGDIRVEGVRAGQRVDHAAGGHKSGRDATITVVPDVPLGKTARAEKGLEASHAVVVRDFHLTISNASSLSHIFIEPVGWNIQIVEDDRAVFCIICNEKTLVKVHDVAIAWKLVIRESIDWNASN